MKCEQCRYWKDRKKNTDGKRGGFCWWAPPGNNGLRPPVPHDEFCSRFKEKK